MDDTALDILEEAGMTEDDLPPPPQNSGHSSLAPPPISYSQSEINWPIKNLGESFFDRALAHGGVDGLAGDGVPNGMANGGDQLDAWAADEQIDAADGDEAGEDEGWDLDAEVIAAPEEEIVEAEAVGGEADLSEGVSPGVAENDVWVRNSPIAADHAAAGAFESAMQVSTYMCRSEDQADMVLKLLNRQVAAVHFAPLKPLFLTAYQSAHVYVPANASLPPLQYSVRRNPETTELREVLPAIAFSLDDIKANELAEANRYFGRGKFAEALSAFRTILQKLLLVVVTSEADAAEVRH